MEWIRGSADVLVVGGGGAGSRAALEAAASGATVAIVNKMGYGISGATAFRAAVIGQYQAVEADRSEGDSVDVHEADIMRAAKGMADRKLVRALVEEAFDRLVDLERWGVQFEKRNDRHHIVKGCFASIPRSHVLKDHGFLIVQALHNAVRANSAIKVYEHTLVTDLIVKNGRCIGALAVDRDNQWIAIEAGAVVIASGGASRIFQSSMYPNDITGDSYSLGFQAGTEFANMEFVQLGLVTVHPRGGAVNTWTWRMKPRLYNGDGESFLESYLQPGTSYEQAMDLKANHWPFTTSDASCAIEISVQDQILKGKGAKRGGMLVDFTHVGDEQVAALPESFQPVWLMMVDNFRKRGIDLSREPLEAVVGSHSVNGGFVIDETTATTTPGLFACGECAAGMHGADRLGGNNLPSSQVFGRRAGYYSAKFALENGRLEIGKELPGASIDKWQRHISNRQQSPPVSELRNRLNEAVSRSLSTNRTEEGLSELIDTIQDLKGEFERGVRIRSRVMPMCEFHHMLQAAELIAVAARERKESRGPHHRRDYPYMDERQGAPIYMRRDSSGGIQIGRPYERKAEKTL